MMDNGIVWAIVGILLFILVVWLIWYFWPRNGNSEEVIIIKKSKKDDVDTPIIDGKPSPSTDYTADETVYTPNETPVIAGSMDEYAPVEEEDEEGIRLTPGIKTPERN